MKVIDGYLPINKRLGRLMRKARLERALKGKISEELRRNIYKSIGCGACRYNSMDGRVFGGQINACRKIGIKTKAAANLYFSKDVVTEIIYCMQFEEKEEED